MVDTQDAIDTLELALASGTLEVTFSDGRRVKYQSTAELKSALQYFQQKLASASGGGGGVNVTIGAFFRD